MTLEPWASSICDLNVMRLTLRFDVNHKAILTIAISSFGEMISSSYQQEWDMIIISEERLRMPSFSHWLDPRDDFHFMMSFYDKHFIEKFMTGFSNLDLSLLYVSKGSTHVCYGHFESTSRWLSECLLGDLLVCPKSHQVLFTQWKFEKRILLCFYRLVMYGNQREILQCKGKQAIRFPAIHVCPVLHLLCAFHLCNLSSFFFYWLSLCGEGGSTSYEFCVIFYDRMLFLR